MVNARGVNNMHSVGVLANPDIRLGIKAYANWLTIS
jgi:glutaredoxin-related protein